jgi:glycosyltransferase involved in cell wall biosynthesis
MLLDRHKRRYLIFEPTIEGHVREWLCHLVRYAAGHNQYDDVFFLVAPELIYELEMEIPARARERIRIVGLKEDERQAATTGSLISRGRVKIRLMNIYLEAAAADAGHFLSIDHVAPFLGLGARFGGRNVCGILFRPSVHYSIIGPYRPTLRERLRDLRKAAIYRMMLLNPCVNAVLSLDPHFADYARAHYSYGDKIRPIHDPINPSAFRARGGAHSPIGASRRRFLLFGSITERKGVLKLIEALSLLPRRIANRIHVTVAGRVDPALLDTITQGRRMLEQSQPGLSLAIENRRLTNSELAEMVAACDVILAPYQRFVGASGVVLWAAAAQKPVLAQDLGLVGSMVRENRLGVTVDTEVSGRLAAGMQKFVDANPLDFFDPETAERFVAAHDVDRFSRCVFESLADLPNARAQSGTVSRTTSV